MNVGRLLWIIAAAILIMVVNVGLSVLYMVFYSYLVNPGQSEQFYQDHVQIAAPYCSIVFGIPLFYFVCRWIGGKWEKQFAVKAAIGVWIVYALIDVTALLAVGLTLWAAGLVTISMLTKLLSAYFGALSASKKTS